MNSKILFLLIILGKSSSKDSTEAFETSGCVMQPYRTMVPKFRLINEIRHVIKPKSSAEQLCWSGNHRTTTCFYRQTRKTLMMSYLKGTPSNNPGRFRNQQLPRRPQCYPWVTHVFFLQNLHVPGFWQAHEQRQSWSHIMNIKLSDPFSCRLSGNCATQMAR